MDKIVFECESITPMFMYGADKNTPELRPASIKGLMRFWWRAIHGNLPLNKLKEQEDEIFGNTEKKSSFSIKMKSYRFSSNKIPQNHKFLVEFIKSNKCDFDVQSFFELVILLGGFGKSAKRKDKGKIKILQIKKDNKEWENYTEPQDIKNIFKLLQMFNEKFKIQNNEIVSVDFKFNYPMISKIWIEDNTLNVKLKENKIFQRKINA